jgi:uncharacterized protein (UPF0335 family)
MTDPNGPITGAKKSDLKQRAEHIAGLQRLLDQHKATAKGVAERIKEAFEAAANEGYNAKALKPVIAEFMMDEGGRGAYYQTTMAFEDEKDILRHALGLAPDDDVDDATARKLAAGQRLAEMAREDGQHHETTISLNGGPEVPLSVAMAAMKVVKAGKARKPEVVA